AAGIYPAFQRARHCRPRHCIGSAHYDRYQCHHRLQHQYREIDAYRCGHDSCTHRVFGYHRVFILHRKKGEEMIDIIIGVLCTIGALAILIAAVGILRMPDFYLRLSVTVKAATLGGGLLLLSAAFYFPDEVSVTTKALAIIFFLVLTAPVAAHL